MESDSASPFSAAETTRGNHTINFLKNAWYMAAWSSQIGAEIFARRLLDQPRAARAGARRSVHAEYDRSARPVRRRARVSSMRRSPAVSVCVLGCTEQYHNTPF